MGRSLEDAMPTPRKRKTQKVQRSPALDFNHAMIYVKDVTKSLGFYGDVLGFKPVELFHYGGRCVYARLRSPAGPGTIALHMIEPGKRMQPSETMRLYFETKDVEGACDRLERQGVTIAQPPKMMPWGWKHAYVNDPDGHEVSLYWAGAKRFRKSKMPT
jgi:lactoylglutathione lyase